MSDLIKQLRSDGHAADSHTFGLMSKAADEIDRLSAENNNLKATIAATAEQIIALPYDLRERILFYTGKQDV